MFPIVDGTMNVTRSDLTRILLVEDDPDIQIVANLALQSVGGYTVQICSSGREALDVGSSFDPDLILLDVMMPEMDGPKTLKAIRAMPQLATTPVIFLTAKVQTHEVSYYQQLGALDVIAKPFGPMTLASEVSQIWMRSHE